MVLTLTSAFAVCVGVPVMAQLVGVLGVWKEDTVGTVPTPLFHSRQDLFSRISL